MIALEVYSDAIFYFRADISKKIAAIFFVFVKLHNGLMEEKIQTHLENEFMTSHFYEFLGSKKLKTEPKSLEPQVAYILPFVR